MDDDIQKYADALQETYRADARQRVQEKVLELVRNPEITVGVSGAKIRGLVAKYAETVDLYMEARLRSYQEAYAETGRSPSDEDFHLIMTECKAVRMAEVGRATQAMSRHVHSSATGAPFSEEYLRKLIEESSDHGHDRVLAKWKVWKAKAQLKPEPLRVTESEKLRDVLVPLYNKAEFLIDLPSLTSTSSAERPCSLLFLDLDKFKDINDGPGLHAAGDRALVKCAAILLRVSEGKGTAYRFGGDEFCVMLPNHTLEEAAAVAERIRGDIKAIDLSTSIGVACFPGSVADPSEFCDCADRAQRASKDAGGNQVTKIYGGSGVFDILGEESQS